eukprot:SM000022S07145  [mRNA]  locus=s22:165573:167737:- [translate_table: standard]
MSATDLDALRAYVSAPSGQNRAAGTVLLRVSHSNLHQRFMEIRFDLHSSIESVKERLQRQTGTPVDAMTLQLFDAGDALVAADLAGHRPLGFYGPRDGYRLHVLDLDPSSLSAGGWLEDTSLVKKYEISEEDYNKREDTVRKYKEKLAEQLRTGPPDETASPDYMAEAAAGIQVGARCETNPGAKRGTVAFVGRAESLMPGFWVGVAFDEPVGKHDGRSLSHISKHVQVGDFPERDLFSEELDEI